MKTWTTGENEQQRWWAELPDGRRKKFKTEEEFNDFMGIQTVDLDEVFPEPTEADEWASFDPDC